LEGTTENFERASSIARFRNQFHHSTEIHLSLDGSRVVYPFLSWWLSCGARRSSRDCRAGGRRAGIPPLL